MSGLAFTLFSFLPMCFFAITHRIGDGPEFYHIVVRDGIAVGETLTFEALPFEKVS